MSRSKFGVTSLRLTVMAGFVALWSCATACTVVQKDAPDTGGAPPDDTGAPPGDSEVVDSGGNDA